MKLSVISTGNNSGFSMLFVLGLVAILASMSIMVSKDISFNSMISRSMELGVHADYIAEAGIQNGLFMLDRNDKWRGQIKRTFAGGRYEVLVEQPGRYENVRILSTASYKTATVQIDRLIEPLVKAPLIKTVAGTGVSGRKTGPGNNGQLSEPDGIAVNGTSIFIADSRNHRIAMFDRNSMKLSNYAGRAGQAGKKTGKNGNFDTPRGVAVDASGVLYVSDTRNNAIRRVDSAGSISDFTKTNGGGGKGDGDGGSASRAKLNRPIGIAIDAAGNIFIANSGNDRIRWISALNSKINSAVKNGLNNPHHISFDQAFVWLYIADTGNNQVKRFNPALGEASMQLVAGTGVAGYAGDNGPAVAAALDAPAGVTVDKNGMVLIADSGNNRIRAIDTAGNILTVAGTGGAGGYNGDIIPPETAMLDNPAAIVSIDKGMNFLFSDKFNHRLREVTVKY